MNTNSIMLTIIMTQVPSILAIITVFLGIWTQSYMYVYSLQLDKDPGGGVCETEESLLEVPGGLCVRDRFIILLLGHYRTMYNVCMYTCAGCGYRSD